MDNMPCTPNRIYPSLTNGSKKNYLRQIEKKKRVRVELQNFFTFVNHPSYCRNFFFFFFLKEKERKRTSFLLITHSSCGITLETFFLFFRLQKPKMFEKFIAGVLKLNTPTKLVEITVNFVLMTVPVCNKIFLFGLF